MLISLLAAATLLADVVATPPPAPAPATPPARAADKDPLICKNQPLLGSRMPKKVCMTKSQFEERRQRDRQDLERQQQADPQAHI